MSRTREDAQRTLEAIEERELIGKIAKRFRKAAVRLKEPPCRFEVSLDVLREFATAYACSRYPLPLSDETFGSAELARQNERMRELAAERREPMIEEIVSGREPVMVFGIPIIAVETLPEGTIVAIIGRRGEVKP